MVAGFVIFWPIGLAVLFYLLWSGRMGCYNKGRIGRWHNMADSKNGRSGFWRQGRAPASSGNQAFDEYRMETLSRLEQEEKEFRSYLDKLRHAKDKAEFDQFMTELNTRTDNDKPESQPDT
jgi:Protein of unknown function (DUF2852)